VEVLVAERLSVRPRLVSIEIWEWKLRRHWSARRWVLAQVSQAVLMLVGQQDDDEEVP
jgi:hypothetical protein